jgi:hypothetical protein
MTFNRNEMLSELKILNKEYNKHCRKYIKASEGDISSKWNHSRQLLLDFHIQKHFLKTNVEFMLLQE